MMLQVRHLSKSFGGVHAVLNCSFDIAENSITALIGPNGAGKTTMFDLISGITRADSGTIHLLGEDITRIPTYSRARKGIGRTFQLIRVFPELSVLDNMLLALRSGGTGLVDAFMPHARHTHELRLEAMALLEVVNLREKSHEKALNLSYGQQKLLEIIRAAASRPKLLLLDEPAAGVNRSLLHSIIALIKRLQSEGSTILIIEHDMGFVMNLAEKIIVMDYGKEIAEGTPHEIQKNPKVLEAYLGAAHTV